MDKLTLLSNKEAADIIGVDRATLSRWAASGKISVFHRLGGRTGAIIFEKDEVTRVAREHKADKGLDDV